MQKKAEVKTPVVKKTEVKTAVSNKAEEIKPVETKAAVKEEPKKAEPKKEAVKETAKEATEAVKETAQKAVKKATAKAKKATDAVKEKAHPEVYIQFGSNEAKTADIVDKVKALYVAEGHRESSIKSLQIYLKPEEYAAYYVINKKITGRVDLF